MTDAPIELAPYDPHWPEQFELERVRLSELLAPWLVAEIEHIGSTAVPGLAAKPVIDLQAPVRDLVASRPAIDTLTRAGYCYFPYKAEVMHWFCRPSPALRTHHLHLVPFESVLWRERIAFRDALKRDAALAGQYLVLKRALAERYPHDREAYTDGKGDFIRHALEHEGLLK